MELPRILRLLNRYCSPHLADSWDNVGLLIEPSPPIHIRDILVTNDLTGPVLSEAVRKRINLILSYHPPIFHPLKRVTQDSFRERLVIQCLESRIAVFSPHTGLDAKKGGINDWLISPFECDHVRSIVKVTPKTGIVSLIRVPLNEAFRSFCEALDMVFPVSISSANGQTAELLCTPENSERIIQQLGAFNLPILDKEVIPEETIGYGRLATLSSTLKLSTVLERYKKLFQIDRLTLALGDGKTFDHSVDKIAVCAGSGGSVLRQDLAHTADVFVTGELSHHERLDANSRGISVILSGHSTSERGFLREHLVPELQAFFTVSLNRDTFCPVSFHMSECDHEPGVSL